MTGGRRREVALECSQCGRRNYRAPAKRAAGRGERLELRKHCPSCNAHTLHRESR